MVKMAAARANQECGVLSEPVAAAIEGAVGRELIEGRLHDQFRLDMYQGGAGTSTNMNANEVIANRALELMGRSKGDDKHCDPPRSRQRVSIDERCVSDRPCTSLPRARQPKADGKSFGELADAFLGRKPENSITS